MNQVADVDNVVFLIFRRMRRPLITLVLVYALAILGMTLIPGIEIDGQAQKMGFFHAVYFVSYMATTIGFGEIPHEFSDAQRLWVMLMMYASVIAWLYAIGTILTLLQDRRFQDALREYRFARNIRQMREPFYLICGYGETGNALVQGLTERGRHVVVVEIDEQRSYLTQLQPLPEHVPTLHGDAQVPKHLQHAGLEHPKCTAVVALTNSNDANLKIAITSKLLHPSIQVICRSDSKEIEANMASFGTDHIIDPYDTFATYLATALETPCLYLLQLWLNHKRHAHLSEPIYPPKQGHWVLCGYGRFGKAVYQCLRQQGLEVVVIEAEPDRTGLPGGESVIGRGTEADTLIQARIETASGLVAGTDHDANNLSIVMTARELNEDLFVIIRQNQTANEELIRALEADMRMDPSEIIADRIQSLLATPLLNQFLKFALRESNEWSCELVSRLTALIGSQLPDVDEISITARIAGPVCELLNQGQVLPLGQLLSHPDPKLEISCLCLMIQRGKHHLLLPEAETPIEEGDRLLLCGRRSSMLAVRRNLATTGRLALLLQQPQRLGWLKVFRLKR